MTVTIRSSDDTPLATRRRGDGPPIVLVHGTAGTQNAFALVEQALADRHTVWLYDRRGRGGSGDTSPYSLDREVDDVLAVLDVAGPDAHLVGHSFGAVCALLAAARQPKLRTLTLYEPPLHLDRADSAALDAAIQRLAGGDIPAGTLAFCAIAGITPAETAAMRELPQVWADMCDGGRQAMRELLALRQTDWNGPECRDNISTPTLLLSGSRTGSPVYATPAQLRALVPHAVDATLPGQGHLGFAFDPDVFTKTVLDFITQHD